MLKLFAVGLKVEIDHQKHRDSYRCKAEDQLGAASKHPQEKAGDGSAASAQLRAAVAPEGQGLYLEIRQMRLRLRGGDVFGFITGPSASARSQPTEPCRKAEQIFEQAGKALAAAERAIKRGHGARETRVLVIDPGLQDRTEQERKSLSTQHAARACGA